MRHVKTYNFVARRVFHFRQFGACFHKNMLKLVVKMRGGERQSKRKFRSALLPVLKYTHRWELWLNRNFYWAKEIFILFFFMGEEKMKLSRSHILCRHFSLCLRVFDYCVRWKCVKFNVLLDTSLFISILSKFLNKNWDLNILQYFQLLRIPNFGLKSN